MAKGSGNSKQLTATVRLNTKQFESKLKRIAKGIDALNNAVGKQSNAYNAVNNALKDTERKVRKVEAQVKKVNTAVTMTSSRFDSMKNKVKSIGTGIKSWAANSSRVLGALRPSESMFSNIWQFVKQIAKTLVGIGTMKLAIKGADALIGAENRLNNIAGKKLGNAAYNFDSSGNKTGYSQKALDFTQDSMDKMYVAAKNSRSSYSDMMSNVSKTMTLASGAFDDNIDNAIRFQEVMAKSYTIGGASAAEMHTSMYQLTQALGSGTLQGDELRSVREGAPLAYQAIEQFAQGVLKTDESLKDLAADGKITSKMVVAAVMDMGESIDQEFALTKWRFSEVWNSIKSSAERAFQPVVKLIGNALNEAVEGGMLEKIEQVFTKLAKAAMIAVTIVKNVINWIRSNWDKLKWVVLAGLATLIAYNIALGIVGAMAWWGQTKAALEAAGVFKTAANATFGAFLKMMAGIILVILGIVVLIGAVILWRNGTLDTCNAIGIALLAVAAIAFVIFGWQAALIFALAALVVMFFDVVCGIVWVILTFIGNVCQDIGNIIAVLIAFAIGIIYTAIAFVVNLFMGLVNVIGAAAEWIDTKWRNFCSNMEYQFWNAVANMLEDCEWLLKALNKVAEFFGEDTISIEGIRGKADAAKAEIKDIGSFGDTVRSAWDTGWNTMDWYDWSGAVNYASTFFGTGLEDWNPIAAYEDGANFGSNVMDAVNKWGSKWQKTDGEKKTSILDKLGEKLGLDFSGLGNFPSDVSGAGYNPDYDKLLNDLGDINDNTGSIADSMDLTQEDLEYLRGLADMEWKKEFTTANIIVDMQNTNTINNQGDLDNWVVSLRDALAEELNVVANGVYA